MTTIRDRFIELATNAVRMHYPDADYLDLIAAGESPGAADSMGRASGCGLVVRGLLRQLGVTDPRIVAPYKFGMVMIDLYAMAEEADAFCAFDRAPEPGDLVLIEAPQHIFTVVDVDFTDDSEGLGQPKTLHSIDGGQRFNGNEAVLRCERAIGLASGNIVAGGRHVSAIIDLDALAGAFLPGGAT